MRQNSLTWQCGYLGQLVEIRNRLQGKVIVVIDERDQDQLVKLGDEQGENKPNSTSKTVSMGQQVLLRTVDNFQGEEAKL